MSHVAKIDLDIKNLPLLKKACENLGLVFNEGKETYKWYGISVGDSPLPVGFTKKDLGKSEHSISVPGSKEAYEIGVVSRRDGRPGYALLWDSWQGGYGLEKLVGKDGGLLKQAYSQEVAAKELRRKGFRVKVTRKEDGTMILQGVKL